jgi:hypothetical protein
MFPQSKKMRKNERDIGLNESTIVADPSTNVGGRQMVRFGDTIVLRRVRSAISFDYITITGEINLQMAASGSGYLEAGFTVLSRNGSTHGKSVQYAPSTGSDELDPQRCQFAYFNDTTSSYSNSLKWNHGGESACGGNSMSLKSNGFNITFRSTTLSRTNVYFGDTVKIGNDIGTQWLTNCNGFVTLLNGAYQDGEDWVVSEAPRTNIRLGDRVLFRNNYGANYDYIFVSNNAISIANSTDARYSVADEAVFTITNDSSNIDFTTLVKVLPYSTSASASNRVRLTVASNMTDSGGFDKQMMWNISSANCSGSNKRVSIGSTNTSLSFRDNGAERNLAYNTAISISDTTNFQFFFNCGSGSTGWSTNAGSIPKWTIMSALSVCVQPPGRNNCEICPNLSTTPFCLAYCESKANCGSREICSDYQCVPDGGCLSDAGCSSKSCTTCDNTSGLCVPTEPCIDDNACCVAFPTCISGACTRCEDTGCEQREICDLITHICKPDGKCTNDLSCEDLYKTCDMATGDCIPNGSCTVSSHCNPNDFCANNNLCIPVGTCNTTSDCTTYKQCNQSKNICEPNGKCAQTSDCITGELCAHDKTCILEGTCKTENDCKSGYSCDTNKRCVKEESAIPIYLWFIIGGVGLLTLLLLLLCLNKKRKNAVQFDLNTASQIRFLENVRSLNDAFDDAEPDG